MHLTSEQNPCCISGEQVSSFFPKHNPAADQKTFTANIGIIPASWKWLGKYLHLYFHSDIYQKLILMEKEYISPEVEILDAVSEGVLCASNELLEETEGEW